MKSKIIFILLIIQFVTICVIAQNIVPNYDFEQKKVNIKDKNGKVHFFPYWTCLNRFFYNKIPYFDYKEYLISYNKQLQAYESNWIYDKNCEKYCEKKVGEIKSVNDICYCKLLENKEYDIVKIDTSNKFYKPLQGNNYIVSIGSDKKNLFQVKLKEALKRDSLYYFEMLYYIPRYWSNSEEMFIEGMLGAYFTKTDYTDSMNNKYILSEGFNLSPQIILSKLDSTALNGWVKYSGVFKADNPYLYMILGNFKPFYIPKLNENNYVKICYSIDDIKLMPYSNLFNTNKIKQGDIIKLENLIFDVDGYQLSNKNNSTLIMLYKLLKTSNIEIVINGHNDNVGIEQNNIELSEKRAKAIMDILISKGIKANRLQYKGYGSSKPVATNKSEAGKQQNRRVEIEILKK